MSRPRRYFEGAVISDWPAYCFARIIGRHWQDEVEYLPLHLRAPLEDAREALECAARHWAEERKAITARGSAEAAPAETEAPSTCKDTLTTEEVGAILGVSDRRVRQLARTGELPGREDRGRWTFDKGAVVALKEKRGAR